MNSAILVTARLKSTRLPLKAIKPIMGRPMICHLLDRLKQAKIPDKIIICTSVNPQDDPLETIANEESVLCFRGDPDDVLSRIKEAANTYGVNVVISCTADNPFVDPIYIDKLLEFHLKNGNDYSSVNGLPFGTFSYAVSSQALNYACKIKNETNTEVWGPYFTQTGKFKTGVLDILDSHLKYPNFRLTVDTPEDFELVCKVFDALYDEGRVFSLSEIVNLLIEKPELSKINSNIIQKSFKPISIQEDYL